jgi:hypothetical protein
MKTKIKHSGALALALVAFLTALPPVLATAAEEPPLSHPAAREAARATAWKVARRNPLVNSVKVASCKRLDPQAFRCLALDRGSTSLKRTTCRVWVDVEMKNGHLTSSLKLVSCKSDRLPLLTAAEAETAVLAHLQEVAGAGKELLVNSVGRVSRTEVAGYGGWNYPDRMHPREVCSVVWRATMDDGEIRVTIEDLSCFTPGS